MDHTLPMQYTVFSAVQIENGMGKNDVFKFFAQNLDCGNTLEPPRQDGSSEYLQSMFCNKNKKNMYTT